MEVLETMLRGVWEILKSNCDGLPKTFYPNLSIALLHVK